MSTGESRRVPRFLACLIKGPAGCLAFLAGAAAIFVLLLPAAGGRVIDQVCEQWFGDRFEGELELGDVWFGSVYGRQSIERVILRDPAGDEVLRGSLAGPSLEHVLDGPTHRYGPVRLQLELLRVIADEEGVTNLERALAPTSSWPVEHGRRGSLSTDTEFEIDLELHVVRLRYTSERGREAVLEDLYLRGRLDWGPRATHLVLEGSSGTAPVAGAPWRLRIECGRAEDGLARPWDVALALEGVPTVLVRALCPVLRPLTAQCGPLVDELQWTRKGSAVAFAGRDGDARLAFSGMEVDGSVSGTREAPLELALTCGGPQGRTLLERLLPPLEGLECEDPSASHVVRLSAFHWPLDGDWTRLEGEAELALAPARATLQPLAPGAPAPLVALLGPQAARLSVRAGSLEYGGFQLPLEEGWIRLDGALELATGRRQLGVSGEAGGKPIERVELGHERDGPSAPALPPLPEGSGRDVPPLPEAPEPEH